ncbi:MAG: hypothetical protein U0R76_09245 [Candidatus Nanopelagicales bacterium]
MPVVQRIQSQHFALEQRGTPADDATVRSARRTVAAMAARHDGDDPVGAAREVLEALGLLDAVPALEAVPS